MVKATSKPGKKDAKSTKPSKRKLPTAIFLRPKMSSAAAISSLR